MVDKGVIVSLEGPADRCGDPTLARVRPLSRPEIVSHRIVIPWFVRGKTGDLQPGDEVVYVTFPDNTGMILSRMDGNWTGFLSGDVELDHNGNFKCKDITNKQINCSDVKSSSVASLNGHTHPYTWTSGAGSGNTSKPN